MRKSFSRRVSGFLPRILCAISCAAIVVRGRTPEEEKPSKRTAVSATTVTLPRRCPALPALRSALRSRVIMRSGTFRLKLPPGLLSREGRRGPRRAERGPLHCLVSPAMAAASMTGFGPRRGGDSGEVLDRVRSKMDTVFLELGREPTGGDAGAPGLAIRSVAMAPGWAKLVWWDAASCRRQAADFGLAPLARRLCVP